MDRIGNYETRLFSKYRKNVVLIASEGWRKHSLNTLLEIDVTKPRKLIHKCKKIGEDISFTAWVIKCIAQALSEYKELNAYRLGRNKIVIFEDVDVAIPVEKIVNDEPIPMAYIIRKANEKSIKHITKEIRDIQKAEGKSTQVLMKELNWFERFALNSPFFIRKLLLTLSRRRGLLKKKYMGTVGVTSIGMFSRFSGWVIPLGGVTSLLVAVNGVTKKPCVVNNEIKIRECLHLVVTFDHDLADGGTIARFTSRLVELMENAFGLEDKYSITKS